MKKRNFKKGFTLVELLVVIALLAVLGVAAYLGLSGSKDQLMNEKVSADLLAIENALNEYKEDNGSYPTFGNPLELGENKNVRCFDENKAYLHACDQAAFIQTQIDNELLTKRYLQEVPLDPNTNTRYAYGVTADGMFFQVAANRILEDGTWAAQVIGNVDSGSDFPSLIQAFDGPQFVASDQPYLPYSTDPWNIIGRLNFIEGEVMVNGEAAKEGDVAKAGDVVSTGVNAKVVLYFSDGSVTHLDQKTELQILPSSEVVENDEDDITTKIRLKLFDGEVWNKVIHLSEGSEFNIESTSAIAGVRGTEFGFNVDDELIMFSGTVAARLKTDENEEVKDFNPNQEAVGDEVTFKRFKIPGPNEAMGPGTVVSQSESDALLQKYYNAETSISGGDRPYIVKAQAHNDQTYTIYVTFNGFEGDDGVKVERFMVYGDSQTSDIQILQANVDPLWETEDVVYDNGEQAFAFDIPYANQQGNPFFVDGQMESIVLMAEHAGGLSELSWPPIGLEPSPTEEYAYDFETFYGEDEADPNISKMVNLKLTSDTDRVAAEGSRVLVATATYDDQSTKDVTAECEWNLEELTLGLIEENKPVYKANANVEGGETVTCTVDDFLASYEIAILPKVMASCFGKNLINDKGQGDDMGLWQNESCWILANQKQSCTDACQDNQLLPGASAQCDPDPNWNDCGLDGLCGGQNAGDDGAICIGLIGKQPEKVSSTSNAFSPFYVSETNFCFPREGQSLTECSSIPGQLEERICKCI